MKGILTGRFQTVKAFAEHLSDAYSTHRYRGGWSGCIRALIARGYGEREIEAILRSKWTRWAADSANKERGANSADLLRFMDDPKNRCTRDAVAQMVLETFGGEEKQ